MIKLSPTEKEIMEVLWNSEGMTNNDIIVYFKKYGKEWKRQTTNTFLTRLVEKNLVVHDNHIYYPKFSKSEFEHIQATELLSSMYGGDLINFLTALNTEDDKISEEEIYQLKDFIDSIE